MSAHEDALFEALTIHRELRDAIYPIFNSFGRDIRGWSYWGTNTPVSYRQNPLNLKDVVYLNADGQLHRLFGPAYISKLFGIEAWYKDGKLHRVGAPAYVYGTCEVWFYEGDLHRLTGPAVLTLNGPKQYWIYGCKFSEKQYKWEINRRKRKGHIKWT